MQSISALRHFIKLSGRQTECESVPKRSRRRHDSLSRRCGCLGGAGSVVAHCSVDKRGQLEATRRGSSRRPLGPMERHTLTVTDRCPQVPLPIDDADHLRQSSIQHPTISAERCLTSARPEPSLVNVRRTGNPTHGCVVGGSAAERDLPCRREAGVMRVHCGARKGRCGGRIRKRHGVRGACRRSWARTGQASRAAGGRRSGFAKRDVDRTRPRVPAGSAGRIHPSCNRAGPTAAVPGPAQCAAAQRGRRGGGECRGSWMDRR